MAAAVAALMFNPLHTRISDWAERRFQYDLVVLKRDLPALLANRSLHSSRRQLGASILPQITNALHSTRAAFLLDGAIVCVGEIDGATARRWAREFLGGSEFATERDQSDVLFPVRMPLDGWSGVAGWLLLGPRPDGSLYGKDERAALRSVLPAISNAFAYTRSDARESEGRSQLQRTRKDLKELRGRVDAIESAQRILCLARR
jgi:hypothetical protein